MIYEHSGIRTTDPESFFADRVSEEHVKNAGWRSFP
jgi:hypothetical protein